MLTDTALRNAKPCKVTDAQGLYLLVNPRGGKLGRFKHRIDGDERRLTLPLQKSEWMQSAGTFHRD